MADHPTFAAESIIWQQGFRLIAGVDEVGRGPLAGPVAAGAVILPVDARLDWLAGVRDSKQLTPASRKRIAPLIQREAIAASVAFVPVASVDRLGIAEATRLAMLQAINELSSRPDHLLIDAFRIGACSLPQTPIVGGDTYSLSIACASIIAKVARDRVMEEQEALYPGYGFHSNKGYGSRAHLEALQRLGPCDIHRRSFAPVRDMLIPSRLEGA